MLYSIHTGCDYCSCIIYSMGNIETYKSYIHAWNRNKYRRPRFVVVVVAIVVAVIAIIAVAVVVVVVVVVIVVLLLLLLLYYISCYYQLQLFHYYPMGSSVDVIIGVSTMILFVRRA